MSPEGTRTFEIEWPGLATRLESFLARKGVPADQREDLVQETGTRLVGMWNSVDRSRPTWALTLTIALNIIRDRYRRGESREIASEVPDLPAHYDLEQAGLARIELGRVKRALASLTDAQRGALMAELGYRDGFHRPDSSADKMLRSRARRRLTTIVGRASAGFAFQLRRAGEFVHAMVGAGDSGLQGLGCAACALLALGAFVSPHGIFNPTVPTHSRSELAPFVSVHLGDHTPLALRGAASRVHAPASRPTGAVATRRSQAHASRAASTQAAPQSGASGPVPGAQPLPDPPQPPPDLGRGSPKPPHHPLMDRVQALLDEVTPHKL
ncbi:MAG: hypothetical protein QOK47_1203 [Actinomycetota bacterium]|nr:hypothetical protein [Actinomycetota bacterium]